MLYLIWLVGLGLTLLGTIKLLAHMEANSAFDDL